MANESVLIVGSGARFISGISYYTAALTKALSEQTQASLLLIRKLCPELIYPGRDRVGRYSNEDIGVPDVPVLDALDWYWGPNIIRAIRFIRKNKPDTIILQWWTGTVLHTYLLIALIGKIIGAKVILEFHETIEVSEKRIPPVRWYIKCGMWVLAKMSHGGVVHSKFDKSRIKDELPIGNLPLEIIHHGPYNLLHTVPKISLGNTIRLTYFGVIRPYKGIDELVSAFSTLLTGGLDVHLTIAGEVWQNYDSALALARQLPEDRVRIYSHYLDDNEVAQIFSETDIIVLPYRRSSASGPLHLAMAAGLPIVTTDIPALVEVTEHYKGIAYAQPHDAESLAQAIQQAIPLVGHHYEDPHSWEKVATKYINFLETISSH